MRSSEFRRFYPGLSQQTEAAGHFRWRPSGFMPSFAFDVLNIGPLNRFVQCNICMEDMRIAQAVRSSSSVWCAVASERLCFRADTGLVGS